MAQVSCTGWASGAVMLYEHTKDSATQRELRDVRRRARLNVRSAQLRGGWLRSLGKAATAV